MDIAVAYLARGATLVAAGVALSSLVVMHVLPSGLSPLRDAVSRYGISRLYVGYRIATIALGLAGILAAVGIAAGPTGSNGAVIAALVVFGIARSIISWYPMDDPAAERTTTGHAHGVIALVTFAAVTFAAMRLGSDLSRTGVWHAELAAIQASGLAMLVLLLAMALRRGAPGARRYFGAVERLFYLGMLTFIGFMGAALLWSSP